MAREIKKIKQDPNDLTAMAEYYGNQFSEVYFVRDILADVIIAVECAPFQPGLSAPVERANGQRRNIFGYQELLLTTRFRTDTNDEGQRMVGYESASGNDTRLAKVEIGEVPITNGNVIAAGGSVRTLSPFERSQLQSTVRLKQAQMKARADYERYTDSAGRLVERFETFEIVRMK